MRLVEKNRGSLVLMADDAPARAVARLPGAEFIPENPDRIPMPRADEDPFGTDYVLFDDPARRDGYVQWEILIRREDEIVAVAALSESLAGPGLKLYHLHLDSVFVHPDHRRRGVAASVVDMMGNLFRDRAEEISSIDPTKSWLSCEPMNRPGRAFSELVTRRRWGVISEIREASRDQSPQPS